MPNGVCKHVVIVIIIQLAHFVAQWHWAGFTIGRSVAIGASVALANSRNGRKQLYQTNIDFSDYNPIDNKLTLIAQTQPARYPPIYF